MVFQRAKLEGVYTLGRPWATGVPIFIHHRFAPERGKQVSVPIVCAIQNFVCRHCGINLQGCPAPGGYKSVPQL